MAGGYLIRVVRRFSGLSTASTSQLTGRNHVNGQLDGVFYPKLNVSTQESRKSSGSSWKPSLAFLTLNALPLAGIVYYLKTSIEKRRQELSNIIELSSLTPKDAALRFDAICKSCSNTLLLAGSEVVPVLPHPIEADALVFTTEEVINNIDKTIPGMADLFDAVTASREKSDESTPLNFVHFGVSSKSEFGKQLLTKKDRNMTLIYNGSPIDDVVVSLKGTAVIVEDQRVKKYYWRERWGAFVPLSDYILVKFVPEEATLSSLQCEDVKLTRRNGETQWTTRKA